MAPLGEPPKITIEHLTSINRRFHDATDLKELRQMGITLMRVITRENLPMKTRRRALLILEANLGKIHGPPPRKARHRKRR